jgi:hypothetical protein
MNSRCGGLLAPPQRFAGSIRLTLRQPTPLTCFRSQLGRYRPETDGTKAFPVRIYRRGHRLSAVTVATA